MKYIVLKRKRRWGTDVLRASVTRFFLIKTIAWNEWAFSQWSCRLSTFLFSSKHMSKHKMNWSLSYQIRLLWATLETNSLILFGTFSNLIKLLGGRKSGMCRTICFEKKGENLHHKLITVDLETKSFL